MVPTELGNVPGWTDTNYIEFYFAWCFGLDQEAASEYATQLSGPSYASIRSTADARALSNVERWPAYREFAELATALIGEARSSLRSASRECCRYLLQVIDVDESLGCRAETLMAESRRLEMMSVTFSQPLDDQLQAELTTLRGLGATVGRENQLVQPVLTSLQR
jgi:hypothetical protein